MFQIGNELAEWAASCRIASDKNEIDRREIALRGHMAQRRPKAATRTVTHDGVPDFFSYRKSDAGRGFLICFQNLKHESRCGDLAPPAGDPKEFGSFPKLLGLACQVEIRPKASCGPWRDGC